jgi:hypothetical protein
MVTTSSDAYIVERKLIELQNSLEHSHCTCYIRYIRVILLH